MFSSTTSGRAATAATFAVGQAVAGVALQAQGGQVSGAGAEAVQLARAALGVGAGVQLHDVGAEVPGGVELRVVGVQEQGDADAGVAEHLDFWAEGGGLGGGVQAAFGGHLLAALGDQAAGVGAELAGEGDHLVGGGHLEVQDDLGRGGEAAEVGVADVAAVLAQVGGDAVGPGADGDQGGGEGVGVVAAAGVADGGDVVNVDA